MPEGAQNIRRDDDGEIQSFDLPDYTGDEWGDIDFDDFDYDEMIDDAADEEEDSYGEDAAK